MRVAGVQRVRLVGEHVEGMFWCCDGVDVVVGYCCCFVCFDCDVEERVVGQLCECFVGAWR